MIRFRSDLPETLSDPIERNDFEVRAERSRAEEFWSGLDLRNITQERKSTFDQFQKAV